jgi:hypothetical protein
MASTPTIFLLPEIFTQILLHLHPRQLITSCLRINKHWNSFIKTCLPLHQAFFFSHWSNHSVAYNTLLKYHFPDYFPFPKTRIMKGFRTHTPWHEHTGDSPTDIAVRAAFSRKGATWRDMRPYLPDPNKGPTPWSNPQIPVTIQKYENWDGGQSSMVGTVRSEEMWTMGRLYDLVEEHVEVEGSVSGDWSLDWGLGVITVRMMQTCEEDVSPNRDWWRCEEREGFEVVWVGDEEGEGMEGYDGGGLFD